MQLSIIYCYYYIKCMLHMKQGHWNKVLTKHFFLKSSELWTCGLWAIKHTSGNTIKNNTKCKNRTTSKRRANLHIHNIWSCRFEPWHTCRSVETLHITKRWVGSRATVSSSPFVSFAPVQSHTLTISTWSS